MRIKPEMDIYGILVVEKVCVLRRVMSFPWIAKHVICISGGGWPDPISMRLTGMLSMTLSVDGRKMPVVVVGDLDPDGIGIVKTWMYGSRLRVGSYLDVVPWHTFAAFPSARDVEKYGMKKSYIKPADDATRQRAIVSLRDTVWREEDNDAWLVLPPVPMKSHFKTQHKIIKRATKSVVIEKETISLNAIFSSPDGGERWTREQVVNGWTSLNGDVLAKTPRKMIHLIHVHKPTLITGNIEDNKGRVERDVLSRGYSYFNTPRDYHEVKDVESVYHPSENNKLQVEEQLKYYESNGCSDAIFGVRR